MKKYLILFLLLVPGIFVRAQKKIVQGKPFTVQGMLTNFSAKQLFLIFPDGNKLKIDTIAVDSNGKFFFSTYKLTKPVKGYLTKRTQFYTDLFIAPGYTLTINADCRDYKWGPSKNKHIAGYGAAPNKYLFMLDSVLIKINDKRNWFELNPNELLVYENSRKKLDDSIEKIVFNQKINPDSYFQFFNNMVNLDNKFQRLDHLSYKTVRDTTMNYQQSVDYVLKNNPPNIFNNINNESYLSSGAYNEFMHEGYYVYLRSLECKKNPRICNNENFYPNCAKLIANNYQGEIKQSTLYLLLLGAEKYCRSFEELNSYKASFPEYISKLTEKDEQSELKNLLIAKESELLKTQIGLPAPEFKAVDSTGKVFSISDFKGKVVLIDLWGSWCGPCRELTPYLKKVVEKYQSDNRLNFISVAVFDQADNWKKAIIEDKPNWLQLLDNSGAVAMAYVANSVPKFVVINKLGKIVTFDAPISSSFTDLIKILDQEISK